MHRKIVVTGGAGFIGSAFIRELISNHECAVLNVDKLTYAGNLASLKSVERDPRYELRVADVCDRAAMADAFREFKPDAVVHLAAESHVDRSIDGPSNFIQTNVLGTFQLLEVARAYWSELSEPTGSRFRFLHVSTDEVYGDLSDHGPAFSESSGYAPNSPYAATKASADHLARSWHRTYGLPTVITNCSNNYALPISREAHSADHCTGNERSDLAGVRERPADPGLAPR